MTDKIFIIKDRQVQLTLIGRIKRMLMEAKLEEVDMEMLMGIQQEKNQDLMNIVKGDSIINITASVSWMNHGIVVCNSGNVVHAQEMSVLLKKLLSLIGYDLIIQ